MRIEPQPSFLLKRICDSLELTALADMTSPEAKRQLKAALWTLRKIAAALDPSKDLLRIEIADMESLLTIYQRSSESNFKELSGASLDTLHHRHLDLQTQLITVDRRAQTDRETGVLEAEQTIRDLRALYRRMLERENMAQGSSCEVAA